MEIVDDLSEDPGPVDRVDSSQSVSCVEIDIREEGLDRVLRKTSPCFHCHVSSALRNDHPMDLLVGLT